MSWSGRMAFPPDRRSSSGAATKPAAVIWRDVVAAWILTIVLTGALLLTVPKPDQQGSSAAFRSVAPAAVHAHWKVVDAEGPTDDEYCTERDYANERC